MFCIEVQGGMNRMPYIPKEHEKYHLLPWCKEHGGEVFDYPSKMICELEKEIGTSVGIFPYNYESYEEYYDSLAGLMEKYRSNSKISSMIENLKNKVKQMNQKEEWSILKYIGPVRNELFGLTSGKNYYWPTCKDNPVYCGVVDNEEFTAYLYPTEPYMWEILEDPTGMAKRTIYEKADGYLSESEHKHMIDQLSEIAD